MLYDMTDTTTDGKVLEEMAKCLYKNFFNLDSSLFSSPLLSLSLVSYLDSRKLD